MSDTIKMYELPIYEETFATLIIRLELPDATHTMTSAVKLSYKELEDLQALRMPKELKEAVNRNPEALSTRLAYAEWEERKRWATNHADYIANKITRHLIDNLKKE